TVKSGEMGESHQFKTVTGGVSADGAARIAIDLASLDTNEPTRDQRMRDVLFHVADYPEAVVTAVLDPAQFESLAAEERRVVPVTLTVDLHGVQNEFDAELFVTRVGEDKVLVETVEPIQVFAA